MKVYHCRKFYAWVISETVCIMLAKIQPFGSTKHKAQLTEIDFILYLKNSFLQDSYVLHIVEFCEQQ